MNPTPEEELRLEQLVDQTLRGQPPRRAPATLEVRVLAEVARRASLRWWQMSFAHWPVAARVTFLLGSLVAIRVALRAFDWLTTTPIDSASLTPSLPHEVTWIQSLVSAIASIVHFMPPAWVYGVLAIVAIMYAALFGLSATAYRTLYASR
jgi:hypothetical protein